MTADCGPRILVRQLGWLVLSKPSGWHCVDQSDPTGGTERDDRTVERWLRAVEPACDALPEAGLVHRLDEGTSGCLVAATSAESHGALRAAFAGDASVHAVEKRYRAWIGSGARERGQFALCFSGRHKGSAKVTVSDRGEPSHRGVCRWEVLARRTHHDLIEIELIGPGRRHQIRAGFAWLGFPLAGDALYGGTARDGSAVAALHAHSVTIDGNCVGDPNPAFDPANG